MRSRDFFYLAHASRCRVADDCTPNARRIISWGGASLHPRVLVPNLSFKRQSEHENYKYSLLTCACCRSYRAKKRQNNGNLAQCVTLGAPVPKRPPILAKFELTWNDILSLGLCYSTMPNFAFIGLSLWCEKIRF